MNATTEHIDTCPYETFNAHFTDVDPSSTITFALRWYTHMLSDGTMFTIHYWPPLRIPAANAQEEAQRNHALQRAPRLDHEPSRRGKRMLGSGTERRSHPQRPATISPRDSGAQSQRQDHSSHRPEETDHTPTASI